MGWKPRLQGRADSQQGARGQDLRLQTASCVPFPVDVMSRFPHLLNGGDDGPISAFL